jgi:hypothetical protein
MEDAMKRLLIEVVAELSGCGSNLSDHGAIRIAATPVLPTGLSREVARRHHALERWRIDEAFQREQAELLLARRAVTTRLLHGISTLLIPSDRDGPAVRLAIEILGLGDVPVRFVDGDGIPRRLLQQRGQGFTNADFAVMRGEQSRTVTRK